MLSKFGAVLPGDKADINSDGFVDSSDIGGLLSSFGLCN